MKSSSILMRFKEHCRIIPFGIPLEEFDRVNPDEVLKIRKKYGSRIVLGVGRLVYYKGFEYLIRAMSEVDGQLLIVGDGPLRSKLELEAKKSVAAARVTFLSSVEDVIPYYQAANVFALPSIARSEAFGIVQLEAMACRKPVVNTLLDSGVPYVSVNGITGLTVPPADSKALAQALNQLLDNPARCAEYGFAGRQRVEAEFNLDAMTKSTLKLYSDVMSSAPRR
jgi:glycosyltransferase involved in cell wall biosynthesis